MAEGSAIAKLKSALDGAGIEWETAARVRKPWFYRETVHIPDECGGLDVIGYEPGGCAPLMVFSPDGEIGGEFMGARGIIAVHAARCVKEGKWKE